MILSLLQSSKQGRIEFRWGAVIKTLSLLCLYSRLLGRGKIFFFLILPLLCFSKLLSLPFEGFYPKTGDRRYFVSHQETMFKFCPWISLLIRGNPWMDGLMQSVWYTSWLQLGKSEVLAGIVTSWLQLGIIFFSFEDVWFMYWKWNMAIQISCIW